MAKTIIKINPANPKLFWVSFAMAFIIFISIYIIRSNFRIFYNEDDYNVVCVDGDIVEYGDWKIYKKGNSHTVKQFPHRIYGPEVATVVVENRKRSLVSKVSADYTLHRSNSLCSDDVTYKMLHSRTVVRDKMMFQRCCSAKQIDEVYKAIATTRIKRKFGESCHCGVNTAYGILYYDIIIEAEEK